MKGLLPTLMATLLVAGSPAAQDNPYLMDPESGQFLGELGS